MTISGKTKYNFFKDFTAGLLAKWQPLRDNQPLSLEKISQGFKESNYQPMWFIQSQIKTKSFDINTSFRYGGYNKKENIGLEISKGTKNKIIFGTHHLEDIFHRNQAKNLSVYLNIKLQF